MSSFDDYRLAPILDDPTLFDSNSIDLFPLDLPPLQDGSASRSTGYETSSTLPVTPTRPAFDSSLHESARASDPRKPKSSQKNTAPLAEVLNHDDDDDGYEHIVHDWDFSPAKRVRIDIERREERSERIHLPELPFQDLYPQPPPLPPLLQGLHEPPPDARLFPPIDRSSEHVDRNVNEAQPNRHIYERGHASARQLDSTRVTRLKHDAAPKERTGFVSGANAHPVQNETHENIVRGIRNGDRSQQSLGLQIYPHAIERATDQGPSRISNEQGHIEKAKNSMHFSNILRSNTPIPPAREHVSSTDGLHAYTRSRKSTRTHGSAAKPMNTFTPEEDKAILGGFNKWGQKWTWIQAGSEALAARSPRDVRDRFRLRWPERYEALGLKAAAAGRRGRRLHRSKSNCDHGEEAQSQSRTNEPDGFIDPADIWKRPAA